jgi:hypothetical protein
MQLIRALQQKTDKFISSLGFDSAASCGVSFDNPKENLYKASGRPANLAPYLTYRTFDEDTNIFTNDDGFTGFLLEIYPIVGINETLEQNLEYFFADELPANTYFQVLMLASHNISNVLDEWQYARSKRDDILDKFAIRRRLFLTQKANNFDQETIIPRDYKLYICVSSQEDSAKLYDLQQQLVKKFRTLELLPRVLDATNLINLTNEIACFQGAETLQQEAYNKFDLLKQQAVQNVFPHKLSDQQIDYGSFSTRIYQVSEFPASFSLTEMIGLLGDGQRDTLTIPARFMINFTIAKNINEASTASIVSKGRATIASAEQVYSRHNIGLQREAAEWIKIIDQLENGQKLLSTSMLVCLSAPTKSIDEAESSLISLYNIKKFRLKVADTLQLISLIACLPFGSSFFFDLLQKFKLTKVRTSKEVVSLLPMHGEWKGVPKPGMLLIGRMGQVFHFNSFYRISSGNYNIWIFGPSGSGKSVWLQEFVQNLLAQNVKVFVLDIGQSFKNLSFLVEAEMIKFSKEMDISLNPFSKLNKIASELEDQEDKDTLITSMLKILSSMAGCAGNVLKISLIEQALNASLAKGKVSIDTIAEELRILNTKESLEASYTLYPYTKEGRYGKYFSRDSNVFFDKPLTVFEFEEIKGDVSLLSVVIQIISVQIFLQVLSGDRKSEFALIVDEAWMILDYAASFLAEIARTIRKYGGALVTCVQNYEDSQKTADHQAIFSNSTWTVMLKQDEKSLATFKTSDAFGSMIPLIRSIAFKPGRFSECLIYTTGVQVIGRLALDKYSSKVFSTDSKDFNMIQEQISQGSTMDAVIERMIS